MKIHKSHTFIPSLQCESWYASRELCTFSSVCVIRCCFSSPAWPNNLSHCSHLCTFSPLWMTRCVLRFPGSPNDLLHWAHLCSFSLVWDNKCLVRSLVHVNDIRHIVQGCLLAILTLSELSTLPLQVLTMTEGELTSKRDAPYPMTLTTFPFNKPSQVSFRTK